jgi:hypothetical protein
LCANNATLEAIDEDQLRGLLLRVLAWRVGDLPDLPVKLAENYSIEQSESLALLELLCPFLDYAIYANPPSTGDIFTNVKSRLADATRQRLSNTIFETRAKCINFTLEHTPSLSSVLYHDWRLESQVATESLGRIARPVVSITLRIQPSARGEKLLPPLESIAMELGKDMIDALSSGFDRLQTQLTKIVQ